MGQALVIGAATKVYIKKKDGYKVYSKEEILEEVKDCLNLDLYEIAETDNQVVLFIKDNIFTDNIYNLLVNETKNLDWKGEDRENLNKLLNEVKNLKHVQEIEDLIEKDGSYLLHMMTGCPWENISYICESKLCIMATLLTYTFSYKVFLECYCETFRYLRKKLQEAIDNPLKDDVFLMITTG